MTSTSEGMHRPSTAVCVSLCLSRNAKGQRVYSSHRRQGNPTGYSCRALGGGRLRRDRIGLRRQSAITSILLIEVLS